MAGMLPCLPEDESGNLTRGHPEPVRHVDPSDACCAKSEGANCSLALYSAKDNLSVKVGTKGLILFGVLLPHAF